MLLKDLQTLATKLATGTLFHVEKAGKAYSVDYSALAKAIIEEYADSTVGESKQSVQAAIGALNSRLTQKTGGIYTCKGVDMYQHKTYKITMNSGEAYPIFFMYGQASGSKPFAMVICAGSMFSATPTINYNAFVGSDTISNVTASNGVITVGFVNNYAQFTITSKHGFTGEIV